MPGPDPLLAFLVAGDLHCGKIPDARLATLFRAAARHEDAAFLGVPGDLTDAALQEEYAVLRRHMASLPFPLYGCMGNHDALGGPDAFARHLFCHAMRVEAPCFRREIDGASFTFLSTDGHVDGETVTIRRCLDELNAALERPGRPVCIFCHAPLTGTVGAAPGRPSFRSDDARFGLPESAEVREAVRQSGRTVLWISGHTHSALGSERLICTERLGEATLHSVNASSPFFTGRDIRTDEPIPLYRFEPGASEVRLTIEDAETGRVVREERLPL